MINHDRRIGMVGFNHNTTTLQHLQDHQMHAEEDKGRVK
jgi:hypothetical protein